MNKIAQRIKRLIASTQVSHGYKLERAILRFTELVSMRMQKLGMTPSSLAEKIEVKPPYISKILRGKSNFTLDSIIKISSALDADFVFHLVPREENVRWRTMSLRPVIIGQQIEPCWPTSQNVDHYRSVSTMPIVPVCNMGVREYGNTV